MRQFWLENTTTGDKWNFTPRNPYDVNGGCPFANVEGLGYESEITQVKTGVDYFVDKIESKNIDVTGDLYFSGVAHYNSFYDFVADLAQPLELHFSPDGAHTFASGEATWYKPVTIAKITRKAEYKYYGLQLPITLKTHSDVWRRNKYIYTTDTSQLEQIGTPHVYNYFYPYFYAGMSLMAADIVNNGREVYPIIEITNISTGENAASIVNPQWAIDRIYADAYGNAVREPQRALFNVIINPFRDENRPAQKLLVDSRPIVNGKSSQRAAIIEGDKTNNVFNLQSPDLEYINFISIKHGKSLIYFNLQGNAEIKVSYQEERELI